MAWRRLCRLDVAMKVIKAKNCNLDGIVWRACQLTACRECERGKTK